MRLNDYFARSEFACRCECGYDTVDAELLKVLTEVREHFNAPVTVTSGARCESHNQKVGGSPKSQHRYGRAADIQVQGVKPKEVYEFVDQRYPDTFGLGLYESFVHIDTRNTKARWQPLPIK